MVPDKRVVIRRVEGTLILMPCPVRAKQSPGFSSARRAFVAHELDVTVLAGGVETQPQLDFLRDTGSNCAQGYLLSHPFDPERLAD